MASEPTVRTTDLPSPHRRITYRILFVILGIGTLLVAALWVSAVSTGQSPVRTTTATEPIPQQEPENPAHNAIVIEEGFSMIEDQLNALSEQILRGETAETATRSEVKQRFAALAEGLQMIRASMDDLQKHQQEFGQQLTEINAHLDSLAKAIRTSAIEKTQPVPIHKPRTRKRPPFQTDAIDVWDDTTYVALSWEGRSAFLRVGDAQSDWTVTRIDPVKERVDYRGPLGQVYSVSLQMKR